MLIDQTPSRQRYRTVNADSKPCCPSCDAGCAEDLLFCWNCGRALDPEIESRTEYAGFARRFLAHCVDAAICLVGMGLFTVPFTLLFGLPSAAGLPVDFGHGMFVMGVFVVFGLLSKAVAWLYYTLSESGSWRGTPGKIILNIAVTDLEGGQISFKQANKRYWGKLASDIFYLGYLSIFVTEKRQALHDFLAKTQVIRR